MKKGSCLCGGVSFVVMGDLRAPDAISLHLYGRMIDSFNTYDLSSGTRQRVSLEHNES